MKKIYLIILLALFSLSSRAGGIEPLGDGTIKVARFYPNPATNVINFEFKNLDKAYTLQIYNFLGKKLVSQLITNNKMSISLESFYRGLYIYQLKDATGGIVESGKFQVIK
jgi:hypothetical protein